MGKIKAYFGKIRGYMDSQDLHGKLLFIKFLFDIAVCNILYGATISDYFFYRFYKKKRCERKTFVTARDKNRFYKAVNADYASEERQLIQDKDKFNAAFGEYLMRKSIVSPDCGEDAFLNFLNEHGAVFVKPIRAGGGAGILKIYADKIGDPHECWENLCKKGACVVEACIPQHPTMAAIHPESINSLRIATLFDGENVSVLFAVLRCGVGESFVDNHSAGGIAMLVDVETGKVCSYAGGRKATHIIRHPDTGIFFPGFEIPHWDKCLALVNEVARKVSGLHYVGWDVAIMPDGVCLIEANPSGDFNICQEPSQKGFKPQLDTILKSFLEKQRSK